MKKTLAMLLCAMMVLGLATAPVTAHATEATSASSETSAASESSAAEEVD